ncbi:MAG: SGNH/GDSL hydrolase family protein [Pelatocladus maniniholoensis HA4357-MV3]|jgi:phospholipase/lecithinase/hemolysin|uniref:SGNH/GDSL hydrolase family protein n=1 Tax=Pelatocladus maniniholoensis HA4357-MV3 TaxID=1117104 RepID=A0A9E3H3C0_9NOST|nr:SGNH/GDSL hydrolase family protein [Pelatocladus maniniholoensis HA4357-MV3]BAZ68742.1 GDSL family lipase [Fischerella sp. NIES-4106]
MKKELIAAGFLILSFMSPLKSLAATHISKIYVFGDSLSDPGNLYNATKSTIPPSPPYYEGRLSNGKVWVEYLGDELGLSPTLFTDLKNSTPSEGINYAFAGSSSGLGNALVPKSLLPGVLGQIGLFTRSLRESSQSADPDALYIVWGGGNDYVFGNVTDVSQPIANLSRSVALLAITGAKNIMVANLPDLGKLPSTSNQSNSSQLTALSQQHNIALAASLKTLSTIPGVNIIPVDVNSLFIKLQTSPSQFGLTNVTDACLIGDLDDIAQGNFSICTNQGKNPDEFLFWDGVHPTTRTYSILAETALDMLDDQPLSTTSWQNQKFGDLQLVGY